MWKFNLLCMLVFGICTPTFAQYPSYKYRFGFQSSPTLSWITTNDNRINSGGYRLGFKLGFVAEYYFSKSYAVTGGIGFSFSQGGDLNYTNAGNYWPNVSALPDSLRLGANPIAAGSSVRYNLKYIELPFGLKMRTRDFGYWRYFAELPVFTICFLTGAKGNLSMPNGYRNNENVKSAISSANISWGVGFGTEYEVSEKTAISAGIYFHQGFVDMTTNTNVLLKQDNGNAIAEKSKAINNNVMLKLAVLF